MYVPEPSVDETYEILLGLRERYEAHHKLRYTDDSLEAAAKLSHQYISDRRGPVSCRHSCRSKKAVAAAPALTLRQDLQLSWAPLW